MINQKHFSSAKLSMWSVIATLLLISIVFQSMEPVYLSPRNLSNLALQTATLGVLTIGITLVLIIGEIDLSIGAVSGLSATLLAVTSTLDGWPAGWAISAALLCGILIGALQGLWIAFFGAPSFIVTLAGYLIWSGLQLLFLSGQNGQVRVVDPWITSISGNYLSHELGWFLALISSISGVVWFISRRKVRAVKNSAKSGFPVDILKLILMIAASFGSVATLNASFGVPLLLLILLTVVFIFALVSTSTIFGRHLYAVGGNKEAARRNGIRVKSIIVTVFILSSVLAAFAGILEASRTYSVSVGSGGGNTALNAIAAAVIGGTSLFGGKGKILGAILGALVISSIQNGLALMGHTAATQIITTGIILLIAVTLDVSSRPKSGKSK